MKGNRLAFATDHNSPTMALRLTSNVPAAIAVLEVDGPMALEWVSRCWRPHRGGLKLEINAIRYGYTQVDDRARGESIVVCRTGEQRVELHCHGGRVASETLLRRFVSLGAIEQNLPERLNKTNDAILLEAREDLIRASTLKTTAILLDQFRGALGRELDEIGSMLIEGDIGQARSRLTTLYDRSLFGCHLIEPWLVVLAGPPNAGKSSLLNLLLGYTRAIVHEQAGTTRDLLAERSSFEGWPVELIDSAGIRNATDSIEATGIELTLNCVASADCMILLVDPRTGWTETHDQILSSCSGQVVVAQTKSDLIHTDPSLNVGPAISIPDSLICRVKTSSVTGAGLKELMSAVVSQLVPRSPTSGDAVPFRRRQQDLVSAALSNLDEDKSEMALSNLSAIAHICDQDH